MYAMEKQKKGWIKMIITLAFISCLIFVAYIFIYISLLIVADLILFIIKIEQLVKEWYNKYGKIL
jgi:hypothetical protein